MRDTSRHFASAPPPAKPTEKNPFLIPIIILLVVVVVAVIVGVFILWTVSVNFNQSNGSSQTNGNELSFNFHGGVAKANVIAQNLMGKTILINTSAKGLQHTDPRCSQHKKSSVNILNVGL